MFKRQYAAMLKRVDGYCRTGQHTKARAELTRRESWLINNRRTREIIHAAFTGRSSSGKITEIRRKDFADRLTKWLRKDDLPRVLWIVTQFEAIGKPIPRAAGQYIAGFFTTQEGRDTLSAATQVALIDAPHSPFLVYLHASLQAKAGGYMEAGQGVRQALDDLLQHPVETPEDEAYTKRSFKALSAIWSVVDTIAREQMGWVDADGKAALTKNTEDASLAKTGLSFKEPLLQARDERGYIAACLTEFDSAETLRARARAVADMLRQSVRRQFTYHHAYAQAAKTIALLDAEVIALTQDVDAAKLSDKEAIEIIQTLIIVLSVHRKLGNKDVVERIKVQIEAFANAGAPDSAIWLALPELTLDDSAEWKPRSRVLRRRLPVAPEKAHEIKAYFKWAMWMRAHAEADRIFAKLSRPQRETPSIMYYVNILQRQARFEEALNVLEGVNVRALSQPTKLNPLEHWRLLRRIGEMAFLRDTAEAFAEVPQPQNPDGVMVIAARNIDQLRKYPLVVLMELRRRNWAVICLVEGLLPNEATKVSAINVLAGSIALERRLSPAAEKAFPVLSDFEARPEKGEINWMGLNLHHSLMEDARINRRSYDVDFSCPALTETLGRLCHWTEMTARATVYAQKHLQKKQIRAGFMALFNSRLPDTLFRLYCEKEGDPDSFFALQTANGYENYFANFSHEISTRCVIRNVTAYPEVRSASFPRPAFFEEYVQANQHRAADVLERVEHIATAKRISGPVKQVDPEAEACAEKIRAWQARGGKVACLFGRVVCDSAVPYDGGPVHRDFKHWLHDSIDAVRGSDTLLLIKPHPHELNEEIATYLNQTFFDLLPDDLPPNAIKLGHRWFNIEAVAEFMDIGLIYNGTTAIELALLNTPCIQANHFGPIDYPVLHPVPTSAEQYKQMLRFETPVPPHPDMRKRAALWLDYMSNGRFALDYRYHARPVTNKVVYPPWWVQEDLKTYLSKGDPQIEQLADRVLGIKTEPKK